MNKALFDKLLACRKEIEDAFGEPLEWERLEGRRASRIANYCRGSIQAPPEELEKIRQWMIDRLLRLKKVLVPFLQKFTGPGEPITAVHEPSRRPRPQMIRRKPLQCNACGTRVVTRTSIGHGESQIHSFPCLPMRRGHHVQGVIGPENVGLEYGSNPDNAACDGLRGREPSMK